MKRVLIVDDAATVRNIVEFTLKEGGYAAVTAQNAEEALQHIARDSFDIGVFDVNMPGTTGIELTRQLKQKPEAKNMKIVMLTTESGQEIQEQGRAAGCVGWLLKPFQPSDLLKLLNQL